MTLSPPEREAACGELTHDPLFLFLPFLPNLLWFYPSMGDTHVAGVEALKRRNPRRASRIFEHFSRDK